LLPKGHGVHFSLFVKVRRSFDPVQIRYCNDAVHDIRDRKGRVHGRYGHDGELENYYDGKVQHEQSWTVGVVEPVGVEIAR